MEEIKIRKNKESAEKARKEWMKREYQKMVTEIKENKHTFEDFEILLKKLHQPFEHLSSDGYVTHCNPDQSICVNNMALHALDGVLRQKRQQEELARIAALQKKRKSSKRKRTPNTTRGDDGIGVFMGLQDFDVNAEREKRAEENTQLSKEASQLEKHLLNFDTLKSKYNGSIDVSRCKYDELSTLLTICDLSKGTSNKSKEYKKQILIDKNITCNKIMGHVEEKQKKLTDLW